MGIRKGLVIGVLATAGVITALVLNSKKSASHAEEEPEIPELPPQQSLYFELPYTIINGLNGVPFAEEGNTLIKGLHGYSTYIKYLSLVTPVNIESPADISLDWIYKGGIPSVAAGGPVGILLEAVNWYNQSGDMALIIVDGTGYYIPYSMAMIPMPAINQQLHTKLSIKGDGAWVPGNYNLLIGVQGYYGDGSSISYGQCLITGITITGSGKYLH